MDLLSTLTLFGTILGIGAFVGAGLAYLFAHEISDPMRGVKRVIISGGTLAALAAIFVAQYQQAPASSLFTLIPRAPYPGSTLRDCHVMPADLPHGSPSIFAPATPDPAIAGQSLTIRGGSALSSPMTVSAQRFDAVNGTHTVVRASNSSHGIEDVHNGDADIGLSGSFKENDPGAVTSHYYVDLDDNVLAVVPFTIVVSKDLKGVVQNLTERQLIDIYDGSITNWHGVGGPAQEITVINRTEGSATRDVFQNYVIHSKPRQGVGLDEETTDQVLTLINQTQGAIGYAATTSLMKATYRDTVFPVCIDGYGATKANIVDGRYGFWSFEHAYVRHDLPPSRKTIVQDFLRYVCTDQFKDDMLVGNGFLRIRDLPASVIDARSSQEKQTITECGAP